MIKYGLISEIDSRCLEKTIDLIHNNYGDGVTYITEIGCYGGDTANGLSEYVQSNGGKAFITGIDNNKDGEGVRFKYDNLIIGNSDEAAYKIPDESQHLIFVDGCHCFAHVVSDFFCYAPKIKVGGYFAFHDTGEHIKPFKDFQHGDRENPDAYISVRKALTEIGLLILETKDEQWIGRYGEHFQWATGNRNECWELVFDEADPNDEAGGICIFRKLY